MQIPGRAFIQLFIEYIFPARQIIVIVPLLGSYLRMLLMGHEMGVRISRHLGQWKECGTIASIDPCCLIIGEHSQRRGH